MHALLGCMHNFPACTAALQMMYEMQHSCIVIQGAAFLAVLAGGCLAACGCFGATGRLPTPIWVHPAGVNSL